MAANIPAANVSAPDRPVADVPVADVPVADRPVANIPSWPAYRFYMLLNDKGRVFGAYNVEQEQYATTNITTTQCEGLGLWFDQRKGIQESFHLTGMVTRIIDYEHQEYARPSSVWLPIDFSRDIFVFHSTYEIPGHLRFACQQLNRKVDLFDLPSDHWCCRIQQLALEPPQEQDAPWSHADDNCLKQMRCLKRVYVVAGNRCHCKLGGAAPGTDRFVRLAPNDNVHVRWGEILPDCVPLATTNAPNASELLRNILVMADIADVEVCIVADTIKVDDIPFGDHNG